MSDKKLDNPSAFPHVNDTTYFEVNKGMTLRDYFAAKAMGALLNKIIAWNDQKLPAICYEIADAMLAERER